MKRISISGFTVLFLSLAAHADTTLYDPPPGSLGFQYMSQAASIAVPCAQHAVQQWAYIFVNQNHPNGFGHDFEKWSFGSPPMTVRQVALHCAEPYETMLDILHVQNAHGQAVLLNRRDVDLDLKLLTSGILLPSP